jgi:putative nucleotidyltransferase with HDIG domain
VIRNKDFRDTQYTILLADDDIKLNTVICRFLDKNNYKTIHTGDGIEALDIFRSKRPHVVIADLRMPQMDGLELLRRIHEIDMSVPVIIITGFPDMDTAIRALQNGAFDYVIKPFKVEYLIQKIEKALDSIRLSRENIVLSQLVSLLDITNDITGLRDHHEMCRITLMHCCRVVRADTGELKVYDTDRKQWYTAARTENETAEEIDTQWPLCEWVITHKKSMIAMSESDIPPEIDRDSITIPGPFLCVPLTMSNELIGVIVLKRAHRREPFSRIDIQMVEILGSQAAIAISNSRLYESANQRVDELSLVGNFSTQLLRLMDTDEIVRYFFETVNKNFSFDFIGFLYRQRRRLVFRYYSNGQAEKSVLDTLCNETLVCFNQNMSAPAAPAEKRRIAYEPIGSSGSSRQIHPPFPTRFILPVVHDEMNFGAIYFGAVTTLSNQNDILALLSSLVNQACIAMTNSRLYNDMKENYIRTIKALAIAVDAKDTFTHGHSESVMKIAEEIAQEMKLDENVIGIIRDAALLHDIGKIGIPGYILNKPGPLSYEEFNGVMKTHTTLGANIVRDVPFLRDLYEPILYHHENYDGSGYPEGLNGEEIPLAARIIHVADAYEAMTSNRPYRNSLGVEEATQRLREGREKYFDPLIVDALLVIAQRKGWIS